MCLNQRKLAELVVTLVVEFVVGLPTNQPGCLAPPTPTSIGSLSTIHLYHPAAPTKTPTTNLASGGIRFSPS